MHEGAIRHTHVGHSQASTLTSGESMQANRDGTVSLQLLGRPTRPAQTMGALMSGKATGQGNCSTPLVLHHTASCRIMHKQLLGGLRSLCVLRTGCAAVLPSTDQPRPLTVQ